jgi:hypothetical protein
MGSKVMKTAKTVTVSAAISPGPQPTRAVKDAAAAGRRIGTKGKGLFHVKQAQLPCTNC